MIKALNRQRNPPWRGVGCDFIQLKIYINLLVVSFGSSMVHDLIDTRMNPIYLEMIRTFVQSWGQLQAEEYIVI
jgi:hypothetical protein